MTLSPVPFTSPCKGGKKPTRQKTDGFYPVGFFHTFRSLDTFLSVGACSRAVNHTAFGGPFRLRFPCCSSGCILSPFPFFAPRRFPSGAGRSFPVRRGHARGKRGLSVLRHKPDDRRSESDGGNRHKDVGNNLSLILRLYRLFFLAV